VVDLLEDPRLAADDQILAVPTVVRRLPQPIRKLVGDLSDTDRLLVGLQLRPPRSTAT
jgi:circadian clock protein KaiB